MDLNDVCMILKHAWKIINPQLFFHTYQSLMCFISHNSITKIHLTYTTSDI
jgi:hypothetical protein